MAESEDKQIIEHPSETIPDIPHEIGKTIQAFSAMVQSQAQPPINPLFSKFTESHIDKYLDYIHQDDNNAHELKKTNRGYHLAYFLITLIAIGLAIYYILPKDKEFLMHIIQIILAFAGGGGVGYGIKSREGK